MNLPQVVSRTSAYYVENEQSIEAPGRSCFLRESDGVFHTYSVYARGLQTVGGSYYFLDETALGWQEDWEEPKGCVTDARCDPRLLVVNHDSALGWR